MKWKVTDFREGRQFVRGKGFVRVKRAYFTVNGAEHSIVISMKDFEEDNGRAIIEREVKKIEAVLEGTGTGKV